MYYVAYLAKVRKVEGVKAAYYTCNCYRHKVDGTYNTAYLVPRRKQKVHVGKPLTERFAKPFMELNHLLLTHSTAYSVTSDLQAWLLYIIILHMVIIRTVQV